MSMTASEMGKKGIAKVNKMLTPEKRSQAAKKGWARRKQEQELSQGKNKKKKNGKK